MWADDGELAPRSRVGAGLGLEDECVIAESLLDLGVRILSPYDGQTSVDQK